MIVRSLPLQSPRGALVSLFRNEWLLPISLATKLRFLPVGRPNRSRLSHPAGRALVFLWLFSVILARR